MISSERRRRRVWGNVGKPQACPSRALAGRHFPRRSPVARVVDNFDDVGGRVNLLTVGDWFAGSKVGVSLKGWIREHFDAAWEVLADVEAGGALLVVPIKAIPVRTVTRASRWAATAAGSAAADVLLAVDDAVGSAGTTAEVGSACLAKHSESLHKRAPHSVGCSGLPLQAESGWGVLGVSTIPDVLNALRPPVHQGGVEPRVRRPCRW